MNTCKHTAVTLRASGHGSLVIGGAWEGVEVEWCKLCGATRIWSGGHHWSEWISPTCLSERLVDGNDHELDYDEWEKR